MRTYREQWRSYLATALATMTAEAGLPAPDPSLLTPETPPKPELGDIAFPLFPLARVMRKAPPVIAAEAAKRVNADPRARAAGEAVAEGPYVNVRLVRPGVLQEILGQVQGEGAGFGRTAALGGQRIMLEFSCPNTNKPLHLGHLRNDAIGESLSRILAAAGATVRKVNLINNRGVHICKSMLAYQKYGNGTTPARENQKGDHFVGDYYVKYAQHVKEHPEAEEEVRAMLRRWEDGDPDTWALWKLMNGWVIDGIEQTYRRTGISFDTTYYESDIYKLGRDQVLAGVEKGIFKKDPDGSVWAVMAGDGTDKKVLLRSDGTSLYITQDVGLAIQRSKDWPFDRLIYVIGSEQRQQMQATFKVLGQLGYAWASQLHHLAYGMVNLPEGKMKSREGTVVDADDLLDELEGLAAEEIRSKEREGDVGDVADTARAVALGALQYWFLQVTAVKDMTFDPKESIAFNGNTGPYLQYTGARISSLLRKFAERKDAFAAGTVSPALLSLPEEWEIVKSLASFPDAVASAARELNPSVLTTYLFELCKSYSGYYQDHPVLRNDDANLVVSRIALVRAMLQVLRNGLGLLGIPFLEAM